MKGFWPEEVYQKMSICDLILISLYSFENRDQKASFEELLEECFTLFPQKFNFSNKADWPDARKLDRPLRMLRRQKLINGHPREGFSLSSKGQSVALKATNLLRQKRLKLK